jgi:hypothetical protein
MLRESPLCIEYVFIIFSSLVHVADGVGTCEDAWVVVASSQEIWRQTQKKLSQRRTASHATWHVSSCVAWKRQSIELDNTYMVHVFTSR